ncbi:MAG: hypothetical protein ABSF95_04165 [Verrucomicrobiota bacterium]|jgi:hypothetical protein
MKTNHRALRVYRVRLCTGRLALLLLASTVLWMACGFGRHCAPQLATHGPVNQVLDLTACFAVK